MTWQYFNNQIYLFRSRPLAVLFGLIDLVGQTTIGLTINRNKNIDKGRIKKIILSRPDHLGDVLMVTAILPAIRQAFPRAEIHMIIGGWTKEITVNIKHITKFIEFNHFFLNREEKHPRKKYLKTLCELPSVIRTLKKEKYDLGFEFRPFYGNTTLLMFLGGVRYRVGYATAGLGFLLHKTGNFSFSLHFIENMIELLKDANIQVEKHKVRMELETSETARERTRKLLSDSGITSKDNIVILHTGSGKSVGLWETQKWARLGDILQEKYNVKVIIAGGKSEVKTANEIASQMKMRPTNYTGIISIKEFISLLTFSKLVIGLDSFASHASAAVGIPAIVIHNGIQPLNVWKPWGGQVIPVTREADCAPCWQREGCSHMKCIKEVGVEDVIKQVTEYV
jgi:ADP-heptose:LPS heptosyltransferase